MKKLIILLLLLLLPATAMAASWGRTEPVSPYTVDVVPLVATANIFGQTSYQRYAGGTVKVGDTVYYAIRVTVPAKPAPATMQVSAKGVTLNCPTGVALPTTAGSYYIDRSGAWVKDYAILCGVVTDATTARVTAEIMGNANLSDIALGDVAVQADSGGYLWSNGCNGMYFSTYGSGQVYSTWVYGDIGRQRVTASLLVEDSELGSIARYYLRVLGIDSGELLSGNVYMTPRIIQSNFGGMVNTSDTYIWAASSILVDPAQPAIGVPETGMPWDIIACVFALVCMVCLVAVWRREK